MQHLPNVSAPTIISHSIRKHVCVFSVLACTNWQKNVWRGILSVWPKKFALIDSDPNWIVVIQRSINVAFFRMRMSEGFEECWCSWCCPSTACISPFLDEALFQFIDLRMPYFCVMGWIIRSHQLVIHCWVVSMLRCRLNLELTLVVLRTIVVSEDHCSLSSVFGRRHCHLAAASGWYLPSSPKQSLSLEWIM